MMSHNSLRMYQYFQIFIMHNNKSFIRIATCWLLLLLLLLLLFRGTVQGFLVPTVSRPPIHITTQPLQASSPVQDVSSSSSSSSRRNILEAFGAAVVTSFLPSAGQAASGLDLDAYLYKIVRVREATQQERRLIQTGKFKDRARQNVKLAVRFMIQNYQLSDSVVGASAYLTGNAAQMKAIDVGLSAVQNLQTILEYFDSSDVENIKVDSLAGKESLVVKGLESAQVKIDDFLSFFPEDKLVSVRKKIQEENDLNVKEFDTSLGDIINLPPLS